MNLTDRVREGLTLNSSQRMIALFIRVLDALEASRGEKA